MRTRHLTRWRVPGQVGALIEAELTSSRRSEDPWPALERAHLLSQPWAWTHCRSHLGRLRVALRQRDRREITGQLIRLAVADPGSLAGRYPPGNTGRATMSLTETAARPPDIAAVLAPFVPRH